VSAFEVYLIMKADSFIIFFACLSAILIFLSVGFFLSSGDVRGENKEEKSARIMKKSGQLGICGILILCICPFIPSTKTLIAMVVVPKITSERAVNMSDKALSMAERLLDTYLNDGAKPDER